MASQRIAISIDESTPRINPLVGRWLVIAAAILWSTSGLFVKAPIFDAWSVEARGPLLAFWRAAFVVLMLTPGVRRPRWNWYLLPLVVFFTGMNVLYLSAMALSTAANATWLQNLAPWWVFLFSVFWFREPMARRDFVPLLFGIAGVGTIVFFEIQGQARAGILCGIGSGITYAGVVVCMRHLRAENSVWLVMLSHLVASLAVLPWVIYVDVWPSPAQLLVLFAFAAVQMALPYVLFARGLRHISGQEAVALGLLEPVLLPLWVYLIWGEVPAGWTLVGAGFILSGLLLRYVVLARWGRPCEEAEVV